MSGLAGVFMRRGEPADAAAVRLMAATTPHRDTDGGWSVLDGPFCAIRQLTITTDEDEPDRAPLVDSRTGDTLVFDGRLDNRTELIDQLALGPEARRWSDAAIALRAWRAWRHALPGRLLGDYAFVVWDPGARAVFCARDPLGVRPFFYHLSDCAFVFGSEARQVLAHPAVPREPDEVAIAALLAIASTDVARTLYKHVRRLPHARTLLVGHHRAELDRYWRVDLARELTLRGDDQYADAFREVVDRAVLPRLRAAGPVGAYLSGGLDSSSVVATARHLAPERSFTAFSIMFPGHALADERQYSEAVLRATGVTGVQVPAPPFDPAVVREQASTRRDLPDFPNDLTGTSVRRAMAARGIRVALTGSAGDYGLSGSYFQYADYLRHGRLLAFWRRYRDVTREPGITWRSAELPRAAVWPLLPVWFRRAVRPLARRAGGRNGYPWIAPDLARRSGLLTVAPMQIVPAGQLARADVNHNYEHAWAHMSLDMYQRGSTEWQIEDRHPFLDRRVVEFVLSLPDEQRWKNGVTKYVLRRAMADRLPPIVRDRSDASKGEFSHLFFDAIDAIGGERFFAGPLHVFENGWVVASECRSLYARMRALHSARDSAYGDLGWRLWTIAAIEMWYASEFGGQAARKTA